MSLRVGLGASQADLDVQGEIDFDFFDESESTNKGKSKSPKHSSEYSTSEYCSSSLSKHSGEQFMDNVELKLKNENINLEDSNGDRSFNKPLIRVSRDDASGVIQKTIETVIPTPFTYKDNKCGKISPLGSKKSKSSSPCRKSKTCKDENEASDDSSVSSMSGSESASSASEDSFELDESDSMTDVSPLPSPYNCYTPTSEQIPSSNEVKEVKKDGVKFCEDIDKQDCAKCNTIDFRELVNAMNRLQMKQNVSSLHTAKCQSPVMTHNARCRKNLSFSNEEVRRIDGDNQVLLKKIIAQQHRSKTLPLSSLPVRSASAVNRQKHQRQIELENLALLKRLESTKPSKNLCRSHLLHAYDRRSSGLLSRSSSRSSYPGSSSHSSYRTSSHTSGRSSAISVKSSCPSSHSTSTRSRFPSSTDKL